MECLYIYTLLVQTLKVPFFPNCFSPVVPVPTCHWQHYLLQRQIGKQHPRWNSMCSDERIQENIASIQRRTEPLEQLVWLHMRRQEMPDIPQLLCVWTACARNLQPTNCMNTKMNYVTFRDKSVPIEELVNPSYMHIYFIHALVKTYIHILLGLLEILCVKIYPVDSSADSLISQRSHFAQSCRQRGFQELVVLLHGLMLGSQIPFFGGVVPKLFNLVSASGIWKCWKLFWSTDKRCRSLIKKL